MTAALELRGITKRFGAAVANDAVDLRVEAGTVHAVVGENGAGKSTLMRIAYGVERADAGAIALGGRDQPRARHNPRAAIAAGVGMVHQHFMLVPPLTVVENLVLGREPRRGPLLSLHRAAGELAALARSFGFAVDPRARVEDLSVGEQQRVEILKVLWQGCKVLILDEPTAVLTPAEVDELFAVLRRLVGEGATVVLITHKLDEVARVADRVTVMRRGRVVAELPGDAAAADIARAMVGRPVLLQVERAPATPGEVALDVRDLRVRGRAGWAVDGVSFQLRAGEVLGVAGVQGNGQTELVEALAGLRAARAGEALVAGRDLLPLSVAERHALGVAHIPEVRHARGLVLGFSVRDNLALGRIRRFDGAAMDADARGAIERFDIRPPDPAAPAAALSGGNQQKIVVARELERPGLRVLLCAQPTRGVDIGAVEAIHRRIVAARDIGAAVLLVSAELGEIRALADRVAVMYRGRFVDTLAGDAIDFARVGALMTGAAT